MLWMSQHVNLAIFHTIKQKYCEMCSSREIFIPIPRKAIGNSEGEGGIKSQLKKLPGSIKLYWEFQKGGGSSQKPPVEEEWIILGAAQYDAVNSC